MATLRKAKREALAWYGDERCVATKEEGLVDWHHLDWDRDNNTKYNLVPVSPSLHANEHRDPFGFKPYLTREEIDALAWRNFDSGLCERTYGAQRLLAFSCARTKHWSECLRHVAGALTAIRPLFSVDFAVDTLWRSALPSITHDASPFSRAMLAMEISLWLRDTNDVENGRRWLDLTEWLFAGTSHPEQADRLHLARFDMVKAVSSVLSHHPRALFNLDVVREQLGDYSVGKGNADLWEAAFHLQDGNEGKFVDIVEESVARVIPDIKSRIRIRPNTKLAGMTWWTLAHALLSLADAAGIRKRHEERERIAELAYDVFLNTGIVPAGNLPRDSLDLYMNQKQIHGPRRIRTRATSDLQPFVDVLPALEDLLKK